MSISMWIENKQLVVRRSPILMRKLDTWFTLRGLRPDIDYDPADPWTLYITFPRRVKVDEELLKEIEDFMRDYP